MRLLLLLDVALATSSEVTLSEGGAKGASAQHQRLQGIR
jgi:hypothetical protein